MIQTADEIFYIINYRKDDNGEIEGLNFKDPIRIDIVKYMNYLYLNGFRRYDHDDDSFFVQIINDRIIKKIKVEIMQDFIWRYINSLPDYLDDMELCHRDVLKAKFLNGIAHYFHRQRLNTLVSKKPIEFNSDTSSCKYMYFLNGYVEITKEKILLREYKTMKKYIWSSEILQRDFKRLPVDTENIASNVIRQFYGIISGTTTPLGDPKYLPERHKALEIITGYLLHSYYEVKMKSIILTDSTVSEDDEPNGRSGKTLFCKILGHSISNDITDSSIKSYCEINGKNFDVRDKHRYSRADLDTKLVVLNDLTKNFNLEYLFNDVTEGMEVDKKGMQPFRIMAKMIIPTNSIPKSKGDSSTDRFLEFELSDFFSSRRSPDEVFKQWFFRGWNESEYLAFDNYMAECVQAYFQNNCKLITPPSLNLEKRKLRTETHQDFIDYMTDLKIVYGQEYDKKDLYENFRKNYPDWDNPKFLQRTFTAWISKYCKHIEDIAPMVKNGELTDSREKRTADARFVIFEKAQPTKED